MQIKYSPMVRGLIFTAMTLSLSACGWVDSGGRQGNEDPITVELDDLHGVEEQSITIDIRAATADLDGEIEGFFLDLDQGTVSSRTLIPSAPECAGVFDLEDAAATLEDILPSDEPLFDFGKIISQAHELGFDNDGLEVTEPGVFEITAPRMKQPIGLRYILRFVDNDGGQATNEITVCLNSVNEAPTGEADAYLVIEGTPLVVDKDHIRPLLANDQDDEDVTNQPLVTELVSGPSFAASFSLAPTGEVNYSYNTSETSSTDSFVYRLSDGQNVSDPITVDLTIDIFDDPPDGTPLDASVNEGDTVSGNVLLDLFDPEGIPLVVEFTSGAGLSNGEFDFDDVTGDFTYTHDGSDANLPISLSFDFTVDDGAPEGANRTLFTKRINVASLNDAPVFSHAGNRVSLEDAGSITSTAWITGFADNDDNETQTVAGYIVTTPPADQALFSVLPDIDLAGNLSYTSAPDANGVVTIGVQIVDSGSAVPPNDNTSAVQNISITLVAVNDVPSFIPGAAETPLEDAGAGAAVVVAGWATAIDDGDPEIEQIVNFTLPPVSTDNPALFAIPPAISAAGDLTYTLATDQNGTATFSVSLTDNGGIDNGGVDSVTIPSALTITVTPVNDPPVAVDDGGVGFTVLEDSADNSLDVLANDTDVDALDTREITLLGVPDSGGAVVLSGSGVDNTVLYTPFANFAGTETFTYTMRDALGLTSLATVSVIVTGINDIPSFVKGADQTINEDAGAQSEPRWATAIDDGDEEATQILTFNITGNTNPGLFAVAPAIAADGTLSYTPADDAAGAATITATLSDDGGTENGGADTSAVQTFEITVNSVNDAPVFTRGADPVVVEDAGPQTLSDWATAIDDGDAEATQKLTFNITGNTNPGLFSSAPTVSDKGKLTFTAASGVNGASTITLTLSDDGGIADGGLDTSAPQSFTITVTEGNDPPSFTKGSNQVVNEDAGAQNVPGWATAIDDGDAEVVQALTFNITGNTNPGLFSTAPAITAAGTLSYTPADNANGAATITVTLSDNGGTGNGGVDTSAPQSFKISVNAVNDVPSFSKGADQIVDEDAGARSVPGWATAISDGDGEVTQTLTFNVTGNTNPGLFSVAPSITAAGRLSYTPAAGVNGESTMTITLSDNGGTGNGGIDTSASQSFKITVNPSNDAPGFSKGANQKVDEDAGAQSVPGWATAIDDGDSEVVQTLTFNITGNTNPGLFSTAPAITAAGTLSYTPADNANGAATITVTLSDNGGTGNGGVDTSAPQLFTITVDAVNDVPGFSKGADQTVDEDAGAQSVPGWATAISDGDAEVDQTLTFNITGNTNSGLFSAGPTISAAGALSYTPAANANGGATITVTLSDNGGTADGGVDTSASQTFGITVDAVNDVPVFSKGANEIVAQDAGAQTVTNWATAIGDGDDEVTQALTFGVADNSNTGLFSAGPSISSAGTLSYTPAAGTNGSATIAITLSDDGGTSNGGIDTSSQQSFTITVSPPPVMFSGDSGAENYGCWPLAQSAVLTGSLAKQGEEMSLQLYTLLVDGQKGQVVITDSQTGAFAYTPYAAGERGDDTFDYSYDDGAGNSETRRATVIIDQAIMTLGDSITEGVTDAQNNLPVMADRVGYRQPMWQQLTSAGYSVDLIGSRSIGASVVDFDADTEAHFDWDSTELAYGRGGAGGVFAWLESNPADIILVHAGTYGLTSSAAGMKSLLDEVDRWEASIGGNTVTVLVAKIIDQDPSQPDIDNYNTALESLVATRRGDRVAIVDINGALSYPADLNDSVHPGEEGYGKLGDAWFNALDSGGYLSKCP